MAKAVLTSKPQSIYDDLIAFRYHFPHTYLNQMQRAVGDWIVYYEPRRLTTALNKSGGRQAYFATAKVDRLEHDQKQAGFYYAHLTDYLEFAHPVPFAIGQRYFEQALRKEDGSTNKGAFGRSVRNIPDQEYEEICNQGFAVALVGEDRYYGRPSHTIGDHQVFGGFAETPQAAYQRPIVERLVKRQFRDVAFRQAIRDAYDSTCAMTGLKIINGGGRPEVQAAHIQPVASNGPDYIQNGIALSATVHWMFDRGLVSIDDSFDILTADSLIPDQAAQLLRSNRKLILPDKAEFRPHPAFLKHHRETVFKG